MSVHQTKDGRWFVVWYESKKQRRKVLGRGEAARVLAHQMDAAKKIERAPAVTTVTVSEICQAYHLRHETAPETSRNDFYRFSVHLLPILGAISAEHLTTAHLDDYVAGRIKSGVVHTTVRREITALKAALNWAAKQQPSLIARNPIAGYSLKAHTGGESIMPPSPAEVSAILGHSPPHLQRAILLAWYCGMRPGKELLSITWGDVDFDRAEVRVKAARKGAAVTRYVPLNSVLLDHMTQWRDDDEKSEKTGILSLAVVRWRGGPVKQVHFAWGRAKRLAGIMRRIRLYDLRHAFATYSLRGGADLGAVSRIMGHSTPSRTLNTYQHVLRDMHREAVELIPALDNVDNTKSKLSLVKHAK